MTTSRNTWKRAEREVAKSLGTFRTPLSGSNSRITQSDTLHKRFFVEVKYRKRIPFFKLFEEVKEKAKEENKIPMVVMIQKGSHTKIVMLQNEDFINLKGGKDETTKSRTN